MAATHDHVRDGDRSLTPSGEGVYPHDRLESKAVEAGVVKDGLNEKHVGAHVHETGLTPQYTATHSMDGEALTTSQKRGIFYAKYRIFLHAFIWLVMTG
jgi:hypothetical protein